jgi:hypothetical protein
VIVSEEGPVGLADNVPTCTGLANEPLPSDNWSVNVLLLPFPLPLPLLFLPKLPVVVKASETAELEQRLVDGDTVELTVMLWACDKVLVTRLITIATHRAR